MAGYDVVSEIPLVGTANSGGYDPISGVDTTNGGVYASSTTAGWLRVGPTAAFSFGPHAPVVVNTAAAITTNVTLPAGILNNATSPNLKNLTIYGNGTYSITTATPTVAIALKFGSVTLCTLTSDATTNGATSLPFNFTFNVSASAAGATGTLESHGQLNIVLGASAAAAGAIYLDNNTAASSAVDLTSAITMSITGLAAGASNAITMREYVVYLQN